jgi:hypothetical protein
MGCEITSSAHIVDKDCRNFSGGPRATPGGKRHYTAPITAEIKIDRIVNMSMVDRVKYEILGQSNV